MEVDINELRRTSNEIKRAIGYLADLINRNCGMLSGNERYILENLKMGLFVNFESEDDIEGDW